MGIGGGIIMVPAMVYLLSMTQHKAQGTSLAVIIPTAAVGAFYYGASGFINMHYVVWLSVGSFIGAYFGSFWAGKLPEKALKIIYAVFLIAVAVRMFI